jgi:hypothetical protein
VLCTRVEDKTKEEEVDTSDVADVKDALVGMTREDMDRFCEVVGAVSRDCSSGGLSQGSV